MIRDAKFADIPAMAKLLVAMHQRSKYALRTALNDKAIDQMDVHEGEELYTDELLPESESVEWEPPDEPSPLSREESGSQEDLDDPAFRDSATESLDEGDLGEAYTDEENEDEELGNEVLEPDDRDVDDA